MVPDHFGLFGLPERFQIDREELERRYLALSRELHPDRHATAAPGQRLTAVQRTTDLNHAYKVLRDDFRRAEHLLRRRGIELTAADSQDQRATVDQNLLVEILELREVLAESRIVGDQPKVGALADDVRRRCDRAWAQIRTGWEAVDRGDDAPLREIARQITCLRYYRRFLDEVEAGEEG